MTLPASESTRRPRFAILGEFSAGKSTLINLLSNGASLRTQVTATQMSPVWLSHGAAAPHRVDLTGAQHPYTPGDPVDVERTAFVRMFAQNTILGLCDLIDTPGNSDPNINPIAWERMIEVSDAAVWCTPSTQAWRQSERASWREVPERFRKHSILLLTQADKLESDADREKVLRRVTRDAKDEFAAIFMLSLVQPGDFEGFLRKLIGSVKTITRDLATGGVDDFGKSDLTFSDEVAAESSAQVEAPAADSGSVLPRRVARGSAARVRRPARSEAQPTEDQAPAAPARPDVPDENRIAMLRSGLRDDKAKSSAEQADGEGSNPPVDFRRYGNEG